MTTTSRALLCCCLFLTVVLSGGCNLAALPYFLLLGMNAETPAKCPLAKKNDKKEIKVVLLATTPLDPRPEFLRVDRDLCMKVVAPLEELCKSNKEKLRCVPVAQVEKYKDEHQNWRAFGPEEIGKHFGADYVVQFEIDSISLYEQGSANQLYRGRAAISIGVTDLKKKPEGEIYREEYTIEYPGAKGPVPASDSNVAQFKQRFLTVIGREMAWRFTAHPMDEEQMRE